MNVKWFQSLELSFDHITGPTKISVFVKMLYKKNCNVRKKIRKKASAYYRKWCARVIYASHEILSSLFFFFFKRINLFGIKINRKRKILKIANSR